MTEQTERPCQIDVVIQAARFDPARSLEMLTASSHNIGGVVTFTGHCRDEDATLSALELEHYPGMAEAEITRIAEEAAKRWPLMAANVIHRHGKIAPGEAIVLVSCASRHRRAAFQGAEYIMDFLKTRAPFWKKEHRVDGTSGDWVDARVQDDEAEARWRIA